MRVRKPQPFGRKAPLGAGPTQYSAPLTGTSITILPTTRQVIVEPAGTIAALTIVTPAAAAMVDGQRIGFCTTQIIKAGSRHTQIRDGVDLVEGDVTITNLPHLVGCDG